MSGCDNFDFEAPQDEFSFWEDLRGADGTTFYPHVSAEGVLSWTNDGGKPNPEPVNIKGADGKSAYQAAVDAGFTGTEAEFNAYLAGVGDLTEEVAQHQTAINDLTGLADRKAGMLVDTASGAIASFVPDATIPDLLGVSVAVEPVQDLHGYDSPWPGGGGKNKLQVTATTQTINGVTFAVNDDGTVLVNGTATANAVFILNSYDFDGTTVILNGCPDGGSGSTFKLDAFGASGLSEDIGSGVTISTSGARNIRIVVFSGTTMSNAVFKPMIRLASETDPTFAPYSNICPISGRNSVEMERTGVNLLDISAAEVGTAWNGAENTARARLVIPIKRNTQYIQTMNGTTSLDGVFSALSTTVPPSGIGGRTFPYSFNSGENDYLVLGFNKTAISQSDLEALNLQLEPGSTAHAYHPYQGNRYTIQLGQTVYGGLLDVTGGTMTVDRAIVTEDDFGNPSSGPSYGGLHWVDVPSSYPTAISDGAISSILEQKDGNAGWGSTTPCFSTNVNGFPARVYGNFTTREEFKTQFANLQICYFLATPVTIQLDPVTIAAIAEQINNVWADAGDVSVEYAADLKHYIDSKIAAAVAALS